MPSGRLAAGTRPGAASRGASNAPAAARARFGYVASLDGVRAAAILGVMAYHGGLSWAPGGFFGVDVFFVLSGFLITSLLVAEWGSTGTIRLGAFWARRVRRLLPALLVLITGVMLYARFIAAPGTFTHLRSDAIATLLYVANWHFILLGNNYFNQFGNPSPFLHTWSLAIEEQFYIIWPLVLIAVLRWRRSLRPVLVLCVVGAVASAVEMAMLFHAGGDPTRVYYGTDTRAQSLLAGAALAVWFAMRPAPGSRRSAASLGDQVPDGRARRWALSAAGLGGVVVMAWLWSHLSGSSTLTYEGGFAMAAVATVAVIATAVRRPDGMLARVLSLAPVRFIGRISYSLYLWHWPVFMVVDSAKVGVGGYELFAVRVAITFALAVGSFYLIEQPIRRGTLSRGMKGWIAAPAALAGTAAIVVATTIVPPSGAILAVPASSTFPRAAARAGAQASSRPAVNGAAAVAGAARQGTNRPVRVMLVGDSTAFTLGYGMDVVAMRYGVDLADRGILGCGLVDGGAVRVHGTLYRSTDIASACNGRPGVPQWPSIWAKEIASFKPQVVMVLAGRWEVMDRTFHGKWVHIGEPAYDAYIKHQMELAVNVIKRGGAEADLLTAPCYDSGEQPDGSPWPEDNPARVAEYNKLLRAVASEHPRSVMITRFHSMVCPRGHFTTFVDGVDVRSSDGVHFTVQGGEWLASKLLPHVATVAASRRGESSRPASSGGTSSGGASPTSARQGVRSPASEIHLAPGLSG